MERLGYSHIPAVGLAKENEWLFSACSSDPVITARSSGGLQMLQRIRDEAHRFALTYHRLHARQGHLASAWMRFGYRPQMKAALLSTLASPEIN
jgi:excinuclease UvrABC nuclease subunit